MRIITFFAVSLYSMVLHSADLVVISSTSDTLKPGTIIDGSKELKLAAGESISLVAEQGKTVKIDGPYQGVPDPSVSDAGDTLLDSLSKIVTESKPVSSLAVFRGVSTKKSPWTIKTNSHGTYCLLDTESTRLQRPAPLRPATMVISAANGSVGTLEWESDQRSASWPANLKLENESSYSITIEESAAIEVTVLLVPEDLESDAHRVVWLSKAGCKQQAQALLNNL